MFEFFVVYKNFLSRYRSFLNVRASNLTNRSSLSLYRFLSLSVSLSVCVVNRLPSRSLFRGALACMIAAITRAVCIRMNVELDFLIVCKCVQNRLVIRLYFVFLLSKKKLARQARSFRFLLERVNSSHTHCAHIYQCVPKSSMI